MLLSGLLALPHSVHVLIHTQTTCPETSLTVITATSTINNKKKKSLKDLPIGQYDRGIFFFQLRLPLSNDHGCVKLMKMEKKNLTNIPV